MRFIIFLLVTIHVSVCLAQTDSMFVEKKDGSISGYSISLISQISFSEPSDIPTSVHELELVQNVLLSFALYQNYPNPFNPSTTIQYTIPSAGNVEVNVFDIQGRLVRSLDKSYRQAGWYSIVWDSRASSGSVVASGTYFCRILFNGSALVKKILLIK